MFERLLKLFLLLTFGPLLLMIGLNHVGWMWVQLPFWPRVALVISIPAIIAGILYLFAPKATWSKQIRSSIGQLYALPFRGIAWAVRRLRQGGGGTP